MYTVIDRYRLFRRVCEIEFSAGYTFIMLLLFFFQMCFDSAMILVFVACSGGAQVVKNISSSGVQCHMFSWIINICTCLPAITVASNASQHFISTEILDFQYGHERSLTCDQSQHECVVSEGLQLLENTALAYTKISRKIDKLSLIS